MNIPKYIIDLMSRAKYEYDFHINNENYAVGYTIRIRKYSAYEKVDTFNAEIDRLKAWVDRQVEETCFILDRPTKTHYVNQVAIVTIFDPVMKYIEEYIPNKN